MSIMIGLWLCIVKMSVMIGLHVFMISLHITVGLHISIMYNMIVLHFFSDV